MIASKTLEGLTASSASEEPETLTIALDGELDLASAPALELLLRDVEDDRWATVVLDLRELSFIDSSGIRALLAGQRTIARLGGHMVVRHASPTVRRVLAATGVDGMLDLADASDERAGNGRAHPPPADLGALAPAGPRLMEVTNAVVTACKAHTGKGPNRAKAHLRPDALYVVLEDWTTVAERTLLAQGHQRLVADARCHLFAQVAETTQSAVESATNRSVIATRSHVSFDRETALLAFILGASRASS